MMIQEFTQLTGIDPTTEEYAIIEELYYNFDGDKRAFCKDFMEKKMMDDVRKQIISNLHEELSQVYNKIRQQARENAILKAQLEREQEWKPYENDHNVKQADYEKLAAAGARELTDEEAKDMIANEFGFDRSKIVIVHEVVKEEINRHRQIRRVGTIPRKALFEAWDWNYIVFNIKGNCTMGYEMHNGELQMYWG